MNEAVRGNYEWAPIVGRWNTVEENKVTFLGPLLQGPNVAIIPYGICISDVRFQDGEAHTQIVFPNEGDCASPESAGRLLLGYRSPNETYLSAGLGGYDRAYVISRFEPGRGWSALAIAGNKENLAFNTSYDVSVRTSGQRIALDVNGIRVLEHRLETPLPNGQLGLFAWGHGTIQFSNSVFNGKRGTIFVVMEFSDPYNELYTEVIQPIADRFKMRAFRADDIVGPGIILEDIVSGIVTAQIVIAEITPPNQNVFYELGYAHALNKPTILLVERGRPLPFDISGYRCLFYENSIGGKRKVEEGLRKHLEAILNDW